MRFFKSNKRGIMGIGTLIIFIATILVAAVAAAVLISTSNVLQQKSLLVGQEAKKKITNAVDVFSIIADSSQEEGTFNNYEVLMRLSPGSDPLQMRNFDLEFLSNKLHTAAQLYHSPEDVKNAENPSSDLAIGGAAEPVDLDLDDDGLGEEVFINDSGSNDTIIFNLSEAGITDPVDLKDNLSDGTEVDIDESPISIGEDIYGSVEIEGTVSGTQLPADAVTVRKVAEECTHELLPPEQYYCYRTVVGEDDYVLDSDDKIKVLFKTRSENELEIGNEVLFIFSSAKGRLTEVRARAPDVVTFSSTRIWPLS